jgi:hypothetical protein
VTSRGQVATSRRPQLGRLPRRRRASPHAAPRVVRDPEGATRGLDLLWRWAQERSRMLNLFRAGPKRTSLFVFHRIETGP